MDEDKSVVKVLKWVGIIALVALPIAIMLKKRKDEIPVRIRHEEDTDYYSPEFDD